MPAPSLDKSQNRSHLGTLVADMERWGAAGGTAVVDHRGVRRFATGYRELAATARRFAAELEARGIGTGERVVLWGANGALWTSVFFGCVLRGALVVPLDASGSAEFAERILREVTPKLIMGDRALLGKLGRNDYAQIALEDLGQLLASRDEATAAAGLSGDTPLQILFTSGTTGEPKGVVHTHRNLLASIAPIEREIAKYRRYERLVHPLRFLHTLPLSHVFGQFMGLWLPPVLGAEVHYEQRGTASHLVELIPRERINVLAAVPRTLALLRSRLLAERPDLQREIEAAQGEPIARRWWRFRRVHRDLGLRFWAAVCGGATLQPELEKFWATMGFALVQGYGLTETAALVTLNHPFKPSRGSLGAPLPGRELRLGAMGELEVKGDMVARAGWRNGRMVPRESSWLSTGDLATIDADGKVSFLGRTGQRLVTAAGLNVYLQDVEQALERQGEISAAVVLAMPGNDGGDEPAAVLLAHAGMASAAAAIGAANASLAAHQKVRQWWLWPALELPRTVTGKIKRRQVEDWAREQWSQSANSAAAAFEQAGMSVTKIVTEPLDSVVTLLSGIAGRRGPSGDDARLEQDWGLDSMGRVALAAALEEQMGAAVTDGVASGVRTLGDLRLLLRGRAQTSGPASEPGPGESESVCTRDGKEGAGSAAMAEAGSSLPAGGGRERFTPPVAIRYPSWPWSRPVAALRFLFVELLLRPMVAVMAAPRVRRIAEPPAGSMLIIANHRTAMDVPLVLFALPFSLRSKVAVAMSGEMLTGWQQSWSPRPMPAAQEEHRRWWGPPAAILLKALLNVFPLPRTTGFRAGFAHVGRALDRGYSVLIFPEGRRSTTGELLPFKPGLGILAAEAFVPVLPMSLEISAEAARHWWRSEPAVSIGHFVTAPRTDKPEQLTQQLRAVVNGLLDPSS
jgi:long-chain acyl-CoA synthetase